MKSFTAPIVLTDFKCDKCKAENAKTKEKNTEKKENEDDEEEENYSMATKKFLDLPKVLSLHLLRFYQSKSGLGYKNNKRFI